MASSNKNSLTGESGASLTAKRMHPVVARFRSGLRSADQQILDQLYSEAEENIDLSIHAVGMITDLEKILFALLVQIMKKMYLIQEGRGSKEF